MSGGTAAPPSLAAAMERALERLPPTDEQRPMRLARAGLVALESVLTGSGERPSAVDLLAADALLTGACQKAAEEGQESLRVLLSILGPERFEALRDSEGMP